MKDYKLSEMKAICQRQFEKSKKKTKKPQLSQICDDCELKQFCHNAMIDDCPSFWEIEEEEEKEQ